MRRSRRDAQPPQFELIKANEINREDAMAQLAVLDETFRAGKAKMTDDIHVAPTARIAAPRHGFRDRYRRERFAPDVADGAERIVRSEIAI
jgi:hypothetical protein